MFLIEFPKECVVLRQFTVLYSYVFWWITPLVWLRGPLIWTWSRAFRLIWTWSRDSIYCLSPAYYNHRVIAIPLFKTLPMAWTVINYAFNCRVLYFLTIKDTHIISISLGTFLVILVDATANFETTLQNLSAFTITIHLFM